MKLNNYIQRKNKKTKHYTFNGIEILIKDELPQNISFKQVLEEMSRILPRVFLDNIDAIYVGEFEHLKKRLSSCLHGQQGLYPL